MILVDTSVLIDFLQEKENEQVEKFKYVISMDIQYGINVYIYQELLQGAATDRDYVQLKTYLDTQTFFSLKGGRNSFAEAAKIYLKCRKMGYTINSTIDCLIAQTAIENDLMLLHNDYDYKYIAEEVRKLRIY